MRICHILEATAGGTAQVVLDLLHCGLEAGDELTLIYSPLRAEPDFLAVLEAMRGKVRLQPLAMRRKVYLGDMAAALRLWHRLRRLGPFDLIHSHSSKAGALARMIRPIMPRTKQIYTPHAFMAMAPDAPAIYGWIEKILSPLSEIVVCVSEQERRYAAEKLRIKASRLRVVPNGVHLDYPATRAAARKAMECEEDDFIVGFVGRLVPQKNPVRLIEAFAPVAAEHPHMKLAIIGSGKLKCLTLQELYERGMSERVRLFENHRGRDLMPGFDCLLCSSDYESFGLVILEAMAAGVPVISTPVGIAEDAIISGENGFMTREFSAASLADVLRKLVRSDAAARAAMAEAARTQAKHYSISRMADGNRAIYKELLNDIA